MHRTTQTSKYLCISVGVVIILQHKRINVLVAGRTPHTYTHRAVYTYRLRPRVPRSDSDMNNSSILELQTWLVYQRVAIDCAGCLCKYIVYVYKTLARVYSETCATNDVVVSTFVFVHGISARSYPQHARITIYILCTRTTHKHTKSVPPACTQRVTHCAWSNSFAEPRRRITVINTNCNVSSPPPPGRQRIE